LQEYWEDGSLAPPAVGPAGGSGDSGTGGPPIYTEPDFKKYTELEGIEKATKVFTTSKVSINSDIGASSRNGKVMGIIPDEFGKIAWYKDGLLDYHFYDYLNIMCDSPMAALVSSNLKERNKSLKEGDSIYLKWGENETLEFKIYAFVDYWPSYNPIKGKESGNDEVLVVANLSYIQAKAFLEPYQVWMKLKPDGDDVQVTNDIDKREIILNDIRYSNQEIIKEKNDPMLQGTNGSLTLGFVVTMLICAIGFIIYWILSVQKRVLQFGILRAIGLSLRKVLGMIICEQVLISGTAIFIGIIIGGMTSDMFVPVLQLMGSAAEQVPPFEVVAFRQDYVKIYIVIAFILVAGLVVLGRFISRIKMAQAVKLGED
jgi:putative ABC transport system permease protein